MGAKRGTSSQRPFELIERLKNVESEDTSSELSRLGTKLNIKD